ncbi:hypothetical protein ACWIG5_26275 [Streptomyces lydicus]
MTADVSVFLQLHSVSQHERQVGLAEVKRGQGAHAGCGEFDLIVAVRHVVGIRKGVDNDIAGGNGGQLRKPPVGGCTWKRGSSWNARSTKVSRPVSTGSA